MFNYTECVVFLLEQAREKIRKRHHSYICFAIDEAFCESVSSDPNKLTKERVTDLLQARDSIKEYIKDCLGNTYSYEEWVDSKGYPAFDEAYSDNVRTARLAWIDDMIEKAYKRLI